MKTNKKWTQKYKKEKKDNETIQKTKKIKTYLNLKSEGM